MDSVLTGLCINRALYWDGWLFNVLLIKDANHLFLCYHTEMFGLDLHIVMGSSDIDEYHFLYAHK